MSEFCQDSRPIVAEDMLPTAFRVQACDDAPALNANFHPSAAIESYDALEDRSPGRLVGSTLAHFEAKSVASGSAENLSGSTAEVKVCTTRIPVPPPTKPECQTSELYSEIKRMIAAEINRVLAARGHGSGDQGTSPRNRRGVPGGGFDTGRLKPPLPLPEKNELLREVVEVVEDLPESGHCSRVATSSSLAPQALTAANDGNTQNALRARSPSSYRYAGPPDCHGRLPG